MSDTEIKKLYKAIADLSGEIKSYVEKDIAWKAVDTKWKEDAKPVLEMGEKMLGSWSGFKFFVSCVMGIGVIVGGVMTLIKFFKG